MKRLFLIMIMLVVIVGCVPPKQIEQLGIITTYGADISDQGENLIDNTILFTLFDPETQQPMQSVESISKTYRGGISAANVKSSYNLVTGQMQLKVFGKELAEKGIMRLLSPHMRDAAEPGNIYIAVSEPTAKEVLTSKGTTDASKFLEQLIENNSKGEILPKSNFLDFIHKFDDVGIDPIQPVVKLINQKPAIDSIGLFQNDRYVGSLTPEQTFLVKIIIETFRSGEREITLPRQPLEKYIESDDDKQPKENIFLTLSEIKSKAKVSLEDKTKPSFKVDISLDARLLEVSDPLRIDDDKVLNEIESKISNQLTGQLDTLTEKFKELNVDPIGFGTVYNAGTKNVELTEEKWRELLPNIDVTYNVDINIIRHGVIE